jgi:hypothetical protein
MFGHATEAWDAACAAAGVDDAAIRYQGLDSGEPPQGTYWARVSMQTVSEEQETLRGTGVRRFVTVGFLYVQIFAPRASEVAQAKADVLAEVVRNWFRDKAPAENLEFTQAAIDDNVRPEPAWLAVNVSARFWYRQFI